MTSLSSSKWLTCAMTMALLGLALIRNSLALKCYWCAEDEPKEDCPALVCPEEDFFRAFGFNSTKEVHVACFSLVAGKGHSLRFCTPNGMKWAKILGGHEKCMDDNDFDLDLQKQKETEALLEEEASESEFLGNKMEEAEEAKRKQQVTPEMLKMIKAMDKFESAQLGRSSSSGSDGQVCICTTDFCNSEGFIKEKKMKTIEDSKKSGTASGFEFRNGAIIVVVFPAFASLSFVYGF